MRSSDPISLPDDDAPVLPDWPVLAQIDLPDAQASDALARRLAKVLDPGDTLLLSGPLGAGKSHVARALIRDWAANPNEPVPSPTFTLVQSYSTPRGDVWHADLYRLFDPDELIELGLDEAFGQALCLIEWPDRLAPDWPENAGLLHLRRQPDNSRKAIFLAPHGYGPAHRIAKAFAP